MAGEAAQRWVGRAVAGAGSSRAAMVAAAMAVVAVTAAVKGVAQAVTVERAGYNSLLRRRSRP